MNPFSNFYRSNHLFQSPKFEELLLFHSVYDKKDTEILWVLYWWLD